MKKLLIAQGLKPLMMTAMNFLRRSELAVLSAATNDEILKSHVAEHAQLIVTTLDTPGLACETLVQTIRRGETMRNVSILLLCDSTPAQRDRCDRCGADAVVTKPVDHMLFARKVQELLDVAPRRFYRVGLNIAIDCTRNERPLAFSSQNISTNGMLIRTGESLAQGESIACSFFLPDGKHLSTTGKVVRVIKPATETTANHYGVRFESLAPDAEYAIAAFIEKKSTAWPRLIP
jgi:DNA-binding response OmpR family regulator